MSRLFVTVLNMSYTASVVILAVLVLRLLLRKVPRIFSYALWIVVLLRLFCPFSLNASWGIVPSEKLVEIGAGTDLWILENSGSQIKGLQQIYDIYENSSAEDENEDTVYANGKEYSISKINNFILSIGRIWLRMGWIWVTGVALLVLYGVGSYGILIKRLKKCGHKEGDTDINDGMSGSFNIVISDEISSPFVAGLIKPVIYLPEELDGEQQKLVLEHEKIHIVRRDYLIKMIAYLAVCLHWFNPLVWIAFHFMELDMEVSCDEAVLKKIGYDKNKEYAKTLLALSGKHSWKAGTPIAFGENSVKTRIKKAVKLKGTKPWVIIAASIGVLTAAVLLLVNGRWNEQSPSVAEGTAMEIESDEEEIGSLPNENTGKETYTYEGGEMGDDVKNTVTQLAKQYEQFGLSAEIFENDYQFYYNGEPVCFFADNKYGWNTGTFKGTLFSRPANEKNGFTGVSTEYDADGNVVGLVLLSEEELLSNLQ